MGRRFPREELFYFYSTTPVTAKDGGWGQEKKTQDVKRGKRKEKSSKILREWKDSDSACLLKVWGCNGFQMCTTSFIFSKGHKTFRLRGIQTTAGIHRLKIHNRVLFIPCLLVLQVSCVLHPDRPLFILIKPFIFWFHACLSCWCSLSRNAVMVARSWAGVVFPQFPVQTLGELPGTETCLGNFSL